MTVYIDPNASAGSKVQSNLRATANADGTATPEVVLTGATFAKTPGTSAPTEIVLIGGKIGLNAFEARMDAQQNLLVGLRSSAGVEPSIGSIVAGALTTSTSALRTTAGLMAFNELTMDAWRNNTEATLLASVARTATTTSAFQTNYNARGLYIYFPVTSAGTGGLTLRLWARGDSVNTHGEAELLAAAQVIGTGTYVYQLYPGVGTAVAGVTKAVSGALPRSWYIDVVHADGSSWTYSVGTVLIV
jgi:hypothetical protein